MITLTVDLSTAATILGANEDDLLDMVQRQEIQGIRLNGRWRLSVFVLADLLSTAPESLLEFIEDDIFARKIAETDDEELLTVDEARELYQEYLAETS